MNQKIIIADNFYDIAHMYHKSILDNQCLITEETVNKISSLLQQNVKIVAAMNETLSEKENIITANPSCDWIAVIYLTMPSDCVFTQGMSFYTHHKTQLETFPNDYTKSLYGLQTIEDLEKTFDVFNLDNWKEYMNIFVKYNRIVLFRADLWHSYGRDIEKDLNTSIVYQKILLQND